MDNDNSPQLTDGAREPCGTIMNPPVVKVLKTELDAGAKYAKMFAEELA